MAVALFLVVAATDARQAGPAREPASKAAAILTWPTAQREQYIAALDSFFLTRTVKAGPHAHVLGRGRPLAAFETGGQRATDFGRFVNAQRVRGVLVLQEGKVRLERYAPPHSAATRWNSSYTVLELGPPISQSFVPRSSETSSVIPTNARCDCARRCSTFSGDHNDSNERRR